MGLAARTYVSVARPRAPGRRHVYFMVDLETILLGRKYAKHRRRSFGAWLSEAIRDACGIDELDRWVNRTFRRTEEEIRRFEEEIQAALPPYAPAEPFLTVSTVLSERTIRRVRNNARHAGMSESDWMARAAWFYVIAEENRMASERHRGRIRWRELEAEARVKEGATA